MTTTKGPGRFAPGGPKGTALLSLLIAALGVCCAPAAPGEGDPVACRDDLDCSLNGVCSSALGTCACDDGWGGPACGELDLQPTEWDWGYNRLGPARTSSWGGGGWWDPRERRYFWWVTELSENCGMRTWTTNSRTVRASSATFQGPYEREAVEFPLWTHEAAVTRGPNGEYVAFMSYKVPSPYPECAGVCTDGSTPPGRCQTRPPNIESRDPTYMSWAPRARGPWSSPVPVLMPRPQMDTNMAAVIGGDGSLVGLWRDHKAGARDVGHSVVHLVTAANWSDPSTYHWDSEDLFFGPASETAARRPAKGRLHAARAAAGRGEPGAWRGREEDGMEGSPGGVEDMFLWVDRRGHFHAVMHQMYGCKRRTSEPCALTSHAASVDGQRWLYTGPAAYPTAEFVNGSSFTFPRAERPKILFGKDGVTPVALTQGVWLKMGGYTGDDEAFTLLRPIRKRSGDGESGSLISRPSASQRPLA